MYIARMRQVSIAEVRADLAQAIADCADEPIEITRRGKSVAVLVESGVYERLLAALEDYDDQRDFDHALNSDLKNIPWEQVKRDLGIAG